MHAKLIVFSRIIKGHLPSFLLFLVDLLDLEDPWVPREEWKCLSSEKCR